MTYEEYLNTIFENPHHDWVCEHRNSSGDVEYRYIRKSVLQAELLRVYKGNVKWQMVRETITNNGLYGAGLLEVLHPVSHEWLQYTGVASLPHDKVLRLNYPRLEAHCMINACKKIGPRFGQCLNVEEEDELEITTESIVNIAEEKLEILIESASTLEELSQYKKDLPSHLKIKYMAKLKTFIER
jgi:hypothetical protein